MNWELTIKGLLLLGALLNLVSLTFELTRKSRNFALLCYLLGTFVCVALFVINYTFAKAPPFGNMYQVMSFMPIIQAPLYIYVSRVQRRPWLLGYFAATAALTLIGAFFMPFNSDWVQMPALQSVWFVPHVASYVLSYSLATVGTLLAVTSYFCKSEEKQFIEAACGMILLAFPFMTFGLWSGAIWADEVWGGYWSWDMKEVWSLITWGLYLTYFHLRRIPEWRHRQRLVLIAAYIALLTTFFIVNLLPKITSMHSYAS